MQHSFYVIIGEIICVNCKDFCNRYLVAAFNVPNANNENLFSKTKNFKLKVNATL